MIAPHWLGSPRQASAVSSPHQAGAPAALAGRRPKVIVVMPAYNAEATLERTLRDLPGGSANEVILVDDGSRDRTVAIAERLGLTVIRHPRNLGYGANQKTCYRAALQRGAEIIAMIHPDYPYDARLLPRTAGFLELGICDVILGCRIRSRAEVLAGGMPLRKYVANRVLTILENVVLGQNLGDFHSGLRIFRREVLDTIPFEANSNDFVFDSQILAQAAHFGFRIGDTPAPARYFPEASSIGFQRSVVYGLGTLGVLLQYLGHRLGIVPLPAVHFCVSAEAGTRGRGGRVRESAMTGMR
jgi:glycosyltransferase involved in cell wall biosynthesis